MKVRVRIAGKWKWKLHRWVLPPPHSSIFPEVSAAPLYCVWFSLFWFHPSGRIWGNGAGWWRRRGKKNRPTCCSCCCYCDESTGDYLLLLIEYLNSVIITMFLWGEKQPKTFAQVLISLQQQRSEKFTSVLLFSSIHSFFIIKLHDFI